MIIMSTRLSQSGHNEGSVQASFTGNKIKEKLVGYKKLQNKDFCTLKMGDNIRYSINNEFRGGGKVKLVKFPQYLVCMNVVKNLSWSVQMTDPTLIIWVKTKEAQAKEREDQKNHIAEMEKVYKMYKDKKLVPKSKCK